MKSQQKGSVRDDINAVWADMGDEEDSNDNKKTRPSFTSLFHDVL